MVAKAADRTEDLQSVRRNTGSGATLEREVEYQARAGGSETRPIGARVTAVDFSTAQLEHARDLAQSKKVAIHFLEADSQDLSMLDDAIFDVAFSAYALGFVEDIRSALREIGRVLRPGGLFAFSWMSPLYAITEERGLLVTKSYFDRTPIVFKEGNETDVDFHRTYGDWHRALTDAGFVVTDIVEPEPLPRESNFSDVFPLSKIQMIPGTTIWGGANRRGTTHRSGLRGPSLQLTARTPLDRDGRPTRSRRRSRCPAGSPSWARTRTRTTT
ncbi:MAG: methyltransferase domain-containing protein [Candidatus Eisenbacteria bacterium]|uniref:Methyltransferase domain-containing protein n=1 Tax=Eiseniibacteriota bacterium TaxID=2212470 RepID=A0A538SFH8_UNCEI|nr:MAG: methyltransferase domain-containing protein [Candidatus Eisenbacteria bacterium]